MTSFDFRDFLHFGPNSLTPSVQCPPIGRIQNRLYPAALVAVCIIVLKIWIAKKEYIPECRPNFQVRRNLNIQSHGVWEQR